MWQYRNWTEAPLPLPRCAYTGGAFLWIGHGGMVGYNGTARGRMG